MDLPRLATVGVRQRRPRHGDEAGTDHVETEVRKILFRQSLAAQRQLQDGNSRSVIIQEQRLKVKDGGIDLAFLPLYEKNRDVVTSPIAADALVIACPHDHPLAGRTNVPLHSLAGESFVDFQQ